MRERFSLKTASGCRRLLAVLIGVILLFSFIACVFSTDGFTIKIEEITLDPRGATLNGQLYYPAATSDEDSYPAIIVTHGGGCNYGVMRGFAESIARHGFVVFNVSAYGSGMSELPIYDETDLGIDEFVYGGGPNGIWDAIEYVRSLEYVDATRIGLVGHSGGGRRSSAAAALDCGYLSFNDTMINVLYDEFGQTFTADEINLDADELAAERLNADELELYEYIREEKWEYYNTRLKALVVMGGEADAVWPMQTVSVAGHEVQRNCQTNIATVNGWYDKPFYQTPENCLQAMYTDDPQMDQYYVIDDVAGESTILGALGELSILDSEELASALDNRSVRMKAITSETHSKNYFSCQSITKSLQFFEQALNYNRGDLTDSSTVPLAASKQTWPLRAACNCIAMLSMILMLFPLASLITKSKFFAPVVCEAKPLPGPVNKKQYWLISLLAVVATAIAVYFSCNAAMGKIFGVVTLPVNKFFPLFTSGWSATVLLAYICIGSAVLTAISAALNKKAYGSYGIARLNVKIPVKNILKGLLLSMILFACAYLMLEIIAYCFGQDFRLWQTMFTQMKLEYWGILPRYAWTYIIPFLLIGIATNFTVREDLPVWKDTLIAIVVNSAGAWIICLINYIGFATKPVGTEFTLFATFITYYYTLLFIPITVVITRFMYRITHSVWLGVFTNTFISAWSIVAAVGVNMQYTSTTFGELFFGF